MIGSHVYEGTMRGRGSDWLLELQHRWRQEQNIISDACTANTTHLSWTGKRNFFALSNILCSVSPMRVTRSSVGRFATIIVTTRAGSKSRVSARQSEGNYSLLGHPGRCNYILWALIDRVWFVAVFYWFSELHFTDKRPRKYFVLISCSSSSDDEIFLMAALSQIFLFPVYSEYCEQWLMMIQTWRYNTPQHIDNIFRWSSWVLINPALEASADCNMQSLCTS